MREIRYFLIFVILIVVWGIFGCNGKEKTDPVQAEITITKIVDKITKQPIKQNKITMQWVTPEGELLKIRTFNNRSSLTVTMPADGSVRLFIFVDSPGYHQWSEAIRMKFNESKPVTITVEMQKIGIDL